MQTFTDMPDGYRWMTVEEFDEYDQSTEEERRWGWKRDESVGRVTGEVTGLVRQWDCMVEFGLDHEHDAEECERTMVYMSDPFDGFDFSDRFNTVDEFGQTSWED